MEVFSHLPKLLEFLSGLPVWALLSFFAFSNFLENVFPPWPGDSFTVFSGFLAAQPNTKLSIYMVILVTFLGNWLGAGIMFYFGHVVIRYLKETKIGFLSRLYQEKSFLLTLSWFRRHQALVIVGSRFSAGIRFFVAIVAGLSKMHFIHFLGFYTIAISLWCGFLLWAGWSLGENWNQIIAILSIYNKVISFLILTLVLLLLMKYYMGKKKKVGI